MLHIQNLPNPCQEAGCYAVGTVLPHLYGLPPVGLIQPHRMQGIPTGRGPCTIKGGCLSRSQCSAHGGLLGDCMYSIEL